MESARIPTRAPTASVDERNVPLFVALLLVFVGFAAYTVITLVDYGVIGFVEAVSENTAVVQVGLDLLIAATIALTLVYGDARRRGLPFVPYLVGTVFLGSIGLLAYLLHRTWRGVPRQAS